MSKEFVPTLVIENPRIDFDQLSAIKFQSFYQDVVNQREVSIERMSVPCINGALWLDLSEEELKASGFTDYGIRYKFSDLGSKYIVLDVNSNTPTSKPVAIIFESKSSLESDEEYYYDVDPMKSEISFNSLYIAASPELLEKLKAFIKEKMSDFSIKKNQYRTDLIIFDSSMGNISTTKLAVGPDIFPEAYPYIKDLDGMIDSYLNSKQTIMLMQGPPGTGKTTLIRHIGSKMLGGQLEKRAMIGNIVSDDEVIKSQQFKKVVNEVVKTYNQLIVFEDADTLVQSRKTGNSAITPLFTLVDGMFSLKNKWIFSTNLDDTKKIDSALLRPGRCHSFIHSRALTPKELCALAERHGYNDMKKDLIKDMTLAEFYHAVEHGAYGFDSKKSSSAGSQKLGFY